MTDTQADKIAVYMVRRLVHHAPGTDTAEALSACQCKLCAAVRRVCYLANQAIAHAELGETANG